MAKSGSGGGEKTSSTVIKTKRRREKMRVHACQVPAYAAGRGEGVAGADAGPLLRRDLIGS